MAGETTRKRYWLKRRGKWREVTRKHFFRIHRQVAGSISLGVEGVSAFHRGTDDQGQPLPEEKRVSGRVTDRELNEANYGHIPEFLTAALAITARTVV